MRRTAVGIGMLVLNLMGGLRGEGEKQFTKEQGSLSGSGKFEAKGQVAAEAQVGEPTIRIEKDRVMIGRVEVRRATKEVLIPAKVQMREGTIEYFMVHKNGKVHESLLSTEALPQDIQVACLLAGIAENDSKEKPVIEMEVQWLTNGPKKVVKAESLVSMKSMADDKGASGKSAAGKTLEDHWVYSGSKIDEHGFTAAREGSIVALIMDPSALVGNAGDSAKDDQMHMVNPANLPTEGLPVMVCLRRVDGGKK